MSQEKPILDYASPPPTAAKFPTPVRRIVILFLLPALALPFVKYAASDSPLSIVAEALHWTRPDSAFGIMLGLSFFVGIPLVLCHLRLLAFGELSKIECWAGYAVAALAMAPIVAVLSMIAIDRFTNDLHLWTGRTLLTAQVLTLAAVVIAFGVCVIWFLGKRVSHGTRICACLSIPYAAGLLFWGILIGIEETRHLQLGYALSLSVIVGTLIELTALAVMAFRGRLSREISVR